MRALFVAAVLSGAALPLLAETPSTGTVFFPGETIDTWHGHPRHVFTVAGKKAWVVEPRNPLPGKLWTWVTEFPDAFTPRTGVPTLLESGVFHAHISDFNRLGSDEQLKVMYEFYQTMRERGFAKKPVLIGLSRGGFMAYRWAAANPDKVAGIYGDNPVCDLKSWPGGFGKGKGSKSDWENAKKLYHWKTDHEGKSWQGNATDDAQVRRLAAGKIPLLNVVGDADNLVPVGENTAILAKKYQALGGSIQVIHQPTNHHPHGLAQPQPIVDFVLASLKAGNQ